jgi:hypothetical protein
MNTFDSVDQFRAGDRVQLHPATDAWMMGDRYGTVIKIGRQLLHVRMDRSGKVRKVSPGNIFDIYPRQFPADYDAV